MKEIDWANLSFGYMKTDYNVRCYYRDGAWGELELCYVVYASYSLYRLSIKVYPEKSKADPTSMNYLEQWLSYSDEAEKELTY